MTSHLLRVTVHFSRTGSYKPHGAVTARPITSTIEAQIQTTYNSQQIVITHFLKAATPAAVASGPAAA